MNLMETAPNSNQSRYFVRQLVILTTNIALAITAILYNNSLRSASIFLFLFALGIALLAALGLRRGGILVLLICSASILLKQSIGAWAGEKLGFNLLEICLAAGAFILVGRYHDKLQVFFEEFKEAKQKAKTLDLEDSSVGLIRPAIGLLRLQEEVARAIRFKRPISLALIRISPKPEMEWSNTERLSVMRAVATTIKDTTRVLDIPFLVSGEKIALILTDTEINGTDKVINNIQFQLINSKIITSPGSSEPLQQHAQIRFGYGIFLGYSNEPFNLMEAAELSLQRNNEMNVGAIFQNLFIDGEPIGELPAYQTILSARDGILDMDGLSRSAAGNHQQQ
jgi:hypothetical protein